jgi:hypothetical protein
VCVGVVGRVILMGDQRFNPAALRLGNAMGVVDAKLPEPRDIKQSDSCDVRFMR